MKHIFILLGIILFFGNVYAADGEWRNGSGENTPLGTASAADIDTDVYQHITAPAETLLSNYRQGLVLTYNSASSLVVTDGEIVVSNVGETIRLMLKNAASTTVTWTNIDTGSEAISTTYYVYAIGTPGSTAITFKISASSSAPTTGSYYKKIGSFYNDASGNITYDGIENDNDVYSCRVGDPVSKTVGVAYQALTDGFVIGTQTSSSTLTIEAYSDSTSDPTTPVWTGFSNHGGSCCFLVKRGNYYKVSGVSTLKFTPLN